MWVEKCSKVCDKEGVLYVLNLPTMRRKKTNMFCISRFKCQSLSDFIDEAYEFLIIWEVKLYVTYKTSIPFLCAVILLVYFHPCFMCSALSSNPLHYLHMNIFCLCCVSHSHVSLFSYLLHSLHLSKKLYFNLSAMISYYIGIIASHILCANCRANTHTRAYTLLT